MNSNLIVLGSESSVIYYNLNNQSCNVKKIIVTSEIILSSFEEHDVKTAIEKLTSSSIENYSQNFNNLLGSGVLDSSINKNLSKKIQEKFPHISETLVDIQLANYNFMNSMSNTRFNITIRCDCFSLTKYYVEKGTITSNIRNLLKNYIKFEGNAFRLSKLLNFQIEVYESEEIYKHIILKKEGQSLILNSNFGFNYNFPIDYNFSSEIYFSKGDNFHLFKNNQLTAIVKDHSHLSESNIKRREKILSDENLILINEQTKNINDAVIELYLTRKGSLKILNSSLLENSFEGSFENGFVINKSSKNYDKISLLNLRDNFDEELPNPKYLLIRNSSEIKELLNDIKIFSKIDGLIFNETFYVPFLDKLGQSLDIDIIYYKNPLNKSLEIKVDIPNLEFDISNISNSNVINPFSSIISETQVEKDVLLEKLKNIDLSTPKKNIDQDQTITNIAEKIISSPNSSINNSNSQVQNSLGLSGLKGAMGFLADAVINQNQQEISSEKSTSIKEEIKEPQYQDFNKSELVMDKVSAKDLSPISDDNLAQAFGGIVNESPSEQTNQIIESEVILPNQISNIDVLKYENIIGTKILTNPGVESKYYFANSNNLSDVDDGEIFFMTTSKESLGNSHLNYVLPLDLFEDGLENNYFILNSIDDFVSLNRNDLKCFINLTTVEKRIKLSFLEKCSSYLKNSVYVILNKSDLEIVSSVINKIDGIFLKDVNENYDVDEVKNIILGFEKKYLIKN